LRFDKLIHPWKYQLSTAFVSTMQLNRWVNITENSGEDVMRLKRDAISLEMEGTMAPTSSIPGLGVPEKENSENRGNDLIFGTEEALKDFWTQQIDIPFLRLAGTAWSEPWRHEANHCSKVFCWATWVFRLLGKSFFCA
jgi:hypothetical protein